MSDLTIARRYAEALFSLAKEQDQAGPVQSELNQVLRLIRDNPDLAKLIADPLVPAASKKQAIIPIFEPGISRMTLNFLRLVLDKRRERYLEPIFREYVTLAQHQQNIMEAEVRSAVPVSREDLSSLQQKLSTSTGKDIRLNNQVDPDLLGGIVVKLGDRIYDGSVKRRLASLRERLCQADLRQIGVK